jgi:hypothetical protein
MSSSGQVSRNLAHLPRLRKDPVATIDSVVRTSTFNFRRLAIKSIFRNP